MRTLLHRVALAAAVVGLAAGCATQGDDAVSQNGEFTFVSPGGQTRIFYPPDHRGKLTDLTGEDLMHEGRQIHLNQFENQPVVINLWGSWCPPCRAEADDIQKVQADTAPQGVRVLGVDVRDDRQAAQDFQRDRQLNYPSIYDPTGRSLLSLKNYPRGAVPSTIVLDRQHRVAAIFMTQMLASELEPVVQNVANEPPAPG